MRKLYGKLPTELDMQKTTDEIATLGDQEHLLSPSLQSTFHGQVISAKSQLEDISIDMKDLKVLSFLKSKILRNKISNSWLRLSATLAMAKSYCD